MIVEIYFSFFQLTTGMHRFVLGHIIQLFPLLLYIFVQRELWIESCLAERTTSSFEVSLMIMIVMYFHIYFKSCNIGTH